MSCFRDLYALTTGLVLFGLLLAPSFGSTRQRPNVVLLMADDLGWGDTGYQGHPILHTPHLDAMSQEGLVFTSFYAASPVCSPTRGACLTGRHPSRYGVTHANVGHLPQQEICLAEALGEQGYATGHFGKWHLGTLSPRYSGRGPQRRPAENFAPPDQHGFQEWLSTEFAVATWDPYDRSNAHGPLRHAWDARGLYWHNGQNVTTPLKGDDSRIVMDAAVEFIDNAVNSQQPFLAVIWFHAPHRPVVGGPGYLEAYSDQHEDKQHYFACITAMDEQMGRLRQHLTTLGCADNTLLWFSSDNGPEGTPQPSGRSQGSTGGLRGRKRSLYEGGIRVPGLMVWPSEFPQQQVIDTPCFSSDFFPTLLAAVGVPLPADRPYDGVNLLPLLKEKGRIREQPLAFHFGDQSAIRDHRYKLIHNRGKSRERSDNGTVPFREWELYDLLEDPRETRNLIEEQPEPSTRLRRRLVDWSRSCQASLAGADDAIPISSE